MLFLFSEEIERDIVGKHGKENAMREGKGKETMKQMRKIDNSRDAQLLFLLCWFAYFTSYIGRLNYSSAMTAMIQEAVLTKSQAGFISMVYFFAYGIGQFCNGMLGDRFHPGKMIFVGLAICGRGESVHGICRRIRSDGSGLGDQRVCTGNDLATGDPDLRGDGEPGTEDEVLRQYRILTGGRNAGFVSAGGSCDVADRMESRVRRGSDLSVCDGSLSGSSGLERSKMWKRSGGRNGRCG